MRSIGEREAERLVQKLAGDRSLSNREYLGELQDAIEIIRAAADAAQDDLRAAGEDE